MNPFALEAHTMQAIADLRRDWRGARVGVLGLGRAGTAAALYLARRGAVVVGVDRAESVPEEAALRSAGVELRLGAYSDDVFEGCRALVLSPGVDPRQSAVRSASAKGIPVLGELELCGAAAVPVVGVTGTNGKSTTTALTAALLQPAFERVFCGGNFGPPVATLYEPAQAYRAAVLELSSYQLEQIGDWHARVSVVLNVTPDHLDRYASLADYALAKRRLVETQTAADCAILSWDDPTVRAMADATVASVWWFATQGGVPSGTGAFVRDDVLHFVGALRDMAPISLAHARLWGRHNRENAAAAMLAAVALGVRDEAVLRKAYADFAGLEHRLEWVATIGGVQYFNDSKATNDDAAAIAVRALPGPLVLLLGGRSKGAGYARVREALGAKARAVIAFGEAGSEIVHAMAGLDQVQRAATLQEALALATVASNPGDQVVLAPACSSFDEFRDYAHRGRAFKQWVRALEGTRP